MSTLRCNAIQDTNGVERYLARAWVNFNGTGTVAIRASGNVSSITDNGTGLYTVNFTNPMPDVNWSGVITAGGTAAALGSRGYEETTARTTSSWSILTAIITGGTANQGDAAWINVAIFR